MRGNEAEPGITPLAVRDIFKLIESMQGREFLIRVSYMEVRYPILALHTRWRCLLAAR